MMDELYVWINHLLNVYNYDSCIEMAFEMFQDHKMTSGLIKISQKVKMVQRTKNRRLAAWELSQTREQAVSCLDTGLRDFHPLSLAFFNLSLFSLKAEPLTSISSQIFFTSHPFLCQNQSFKSFPIQLTFIKHSSIIISLLVSQDLKIKIQVCSFLSLST